ncbi:MAG: exodeoxyribonuclease VII small subunit [Lachnospiraceae bacterium]|jgi:exodeoxyribonuclease VII small subunit|nr:exodeoxyribonuclease VII small subunit [Lachnospiraceae bacterium]
MEEKTQEEKQLSIEDAFAKVQELLSEMSKEDVTLEQAFSDYEEGMKLIRYCNGKIDSVEQKVQKLNQDGSMDEFH